MQISRGMIDWVTATLPCLHSPLRAGSVLKITSSGDIEWESPCRLEVPGSFASTVRVRSSGGDGQGRATHLWFDGNPSKFLQGHNLFGSDDLLALMADTLRRVAAFVGLSFATDEWAAIEQGDYPISRIDYNQSFELPTRTDVKAWLRAAEFKSKSRHGRPSMKGGTLYFGQHSRRWSMKFYCKGEEIEAPKHRLPTALQLPELLKWADNKLRPELTLRTLELRELELREAKRLTPAVLHDLFCERLKGLEMNEQMALTSEQLHELPQKLRSTYILWNSGEDLRDTLPLRTYYRHRKELLPYGIDIALRRESFDRSNVVPLVRVLEAMPAAIPNWAFDQGLVHQSAQRIAAC